MDSDVQYRQSHSMAFLSTEVDTGWLAVKYPRVCTHGVTGKRESHDGAEREQTVNGPGLDNGSRMYDVPSLPSSVPVGQWAARRRMLRLLDASNTRFWILGRTVL